MGSASSSAAASVAALLSLTHLWLVHEPEYCPKGNDTIRICRVASYIFKRKDDFTIYSILAQTVDQRLNYSTVFQAYLFSVCHSQSYLHILNLYRYLQYSRESWRTYTTFVRVRMWEKWKPSHEASQPIAAASYMEASYPVGGRCSM